MLSPDSTLQNVVAHRIILNGIVQGIGMRPAVARLAQMHHLSGSVSNQLTGLLIVVEGSPSDVDEFRDQLSSHFPTDAKITSRQEIKCEATGNTEFRILESIATGRLETILPADLATCDQCQHEYSSPDDARYRYPMISCTSCGPRYSIIKRMPFEREQSSLKDYDLCVNCREDYTNSSSRRFHAQTIACPVCGPTYWYEKPGQFVELNYDLMIQLAVEDIKRGDIVGLCGVGGYQLLVDGTNSAAVQRLRQRKQRESKPFAVMVQSLDAAELLASLNQIEREILADSRNPIVLLNQLARNRLAREVTGPVGTIGVMLPTTPVHQELCRLVNVPLIVTSGNVEDKPIESVPSKARSELADIADCFLHHNREIVRPSDDSVVRIAGGQQITIRCGRGLSPLKLPISTQMQILAVGAEQKNAIAFSNGSQSILSPHIGDLKTLASRTYFEQQITELQTLYQMDPEYIVHDLHPEYYSTAWATQQRKPLIGVQHHHAHIVSGMLEHNLLDENVLGLAFDGTGLGDDATIWGGEFLLSSAVGYKRVGNIAPFSLPGGTAAILSPWKIAVSLLESAMGAEAASEIGHQIFSDACVENILQITGRQHLSPLTSSMGRLFDGITALITRRTESSYEGQFPMILEALAQICDSVQTPYRFEVSTVDHRIQLEWKTAIRQIVQAIAAGTAPAAIACRFHRGLVQGIRKMCRHFPDYPIVLSGGCFQNRILLETLRRELEEDHRNVFCPVSIPLNDGGLAAGQLAIAVARLTRNADHNTVGAV